MVKCILGLVIIGAFVSGNAWAFEPEYTTEYTTIEDLFADMRSQIDAIYSDNSQNLPIISNKRSPRHYTNQFKLKKGSRYIWDVELTTYSREFAEKYNQPKYLISEDMPDGMQSLSYTQMTIAGRVECLLKIRIDNDLGADYTTRDFANVTWEMIPQHLPGKQPSMEFAANTDNNKELIPGVVYYGRANASSGDIKALGYRHTQLRSFVNDAKSNTLLYVVRVICGDDASERFSDGAALMIRKSTKTAKQSNPHSTENNLYFPLPREFSEMIGYLNSLIK